jgi:hypothetical protein
MYGEPSRIRAVAERLESRAAQLRSEADALWATSDGAAWVSLAADRMRAEAAERRLELVDVARAYDEAATAVRAHATEVQRLLDLIATIERQVLALVGEAVERAKEAVGRVLDGVRDALTPGEEAARQLAQLPLPPPGHREWLRMPGLVPGVRL